MVNVMQDLKNVEYNIDVEFKRYKTKRNNVYTCILQNIVNTINNYTYATE